METQPAVDALAGMAVGLTKAPQPAPQAGNQGTREPQAWNWKLGRWEKEPTGLQPASNVEITKLQENCTVCLPLNLGGVETCTFIKARLAKKSR